MVSDREPLPLATNPQGPISESGTAYLAYLLGLEGDRNGREPLRVGITRRWSGSADVLEELQELGLMEWRMHPGFGVRMLELSSVGRARAWDLFRDWLPDSWGPDA